MHASPTPQSSFRRLGYVQRNTSEQYVHRVHATPLASSAAAVIPTPSSLPASTNGASPCLPGRPVVDASSPPSIMHHRLQQHPQRRHHHAPYNGIHRPSGGPSPRTMIDAGLSIAHSPVASADATVFRHQSSGPPVSSSSFPGGHRSPVADPTGLFRSQQGNTTAAVVFPTTPSPQQQNGRRTERGASHQAPKLSPAPPTKEKTGGGKRTGSRTHRRKSTPKAEADNQSPKKPSNTAAGRRDSRPPEETPTYHGLDLRRFPSNQPQQRPPRRRAVVVGLNYVLTPDILLRGGCNDAVATALTLVNLCDFTLENVALLIDAFPAACYRPVRDGEHPGEFIAWKDRQPTRRNILLALNWLRADTMPGDVLLFYFAGHGIQVDDMAGWEGEGYDEAILPMDFYGEEVNAITAVMIRNLMLSVSNDVQVTMILDCNGGQTMLDPSGTGKWNFIKGVKQRGVWPFITDATDKVARAVYDQTPWMDEAMKKRGARPRFVPGVDVSSTQELLDPTLQKVVHQSKYKKQSCAPTANCSCWSQNQGVSLCCCTYATAIASSCMLFMSLAWSQSAIEAKMSAIKIIPVERKGRVIHKDHGERQFTYHGVFTWCFLSALYELVLQAVEKTRTKRVSYRRLLDEIDNRMKVCKSAQGGLPKLNQCPELTFYRSGGGDGRDFFLWPFGGRRSGVSYAARPNVPVRLPCLPHEQQYLSIWEAEEELRRAGELRRQNDPAFILRGANGGLLGLSQNPSGGVSRYLSCPPQNGCQSQPPNDGRLPPHWDMVTPARSPVVRNVTLPAPAPLPAAASFPAHPGPIMAPGTIITRAVTGIHPPSLMSGQPRTRPLGISRPPVRAMLDEPVT